YRASAASIAVDCRDAGIRCHCGAAPGAACRCGSCAYRAAETSGPPGALLGAQAELPGRTALRLLARLSTQNRRERFWTTRSVGPRRAKQSRPAARNRRVFLGLLQ